jgi:hypothetical protein
VQFQQALVRRESDGNLAVVIYSAEFDFAWNAKILTLCDEFAADSPASGLPAALFVQRLGRKHFIIVCTRPSNKAGSGSDCFHIMVADRQAYAALQNDPFALAERFVLDWNATGELPALQWEGPPPARRTVRDIQKVLKRSNGPELLGGCQALLDGSRLLFVRESADPDLVRDLWALLPYSNRQELMPATFAWNKNLAFDIVVAGANTAGQFAGYMTEEQAGGYPEGRYELSLQTAAEASDQESLNILWARRSRREVWRLGILLVVVMAILAAAMRFMAPAARP